MHLCEPPSGLPHLVCEQLAVGCDHIASDLGCGLNLPFPACQQLVRELELLHCTAVTTHDGSERLVSITLEGPPPEKRTYVAEAVEMIVEARLREIFELSRKRLVEREALEWLGDEVLLSGDGARIPRIAELASEIFKRKIRVAVPYQVEAGGVQLYPRHNTVLGLLRACRQEMMLQAEQRRGGSVWGRVAEWWQMLLEW